MTKYIVKYPMKQKMEFDIMSGYNNMMEDNR